MARASGVNQPGGRDWSSLIFLHISKAGGSTFEKDVEAHSFLQLELCLCMGEAKKRGLPVGKDRCLQQLNNMTCNLYLHEEGYSDITTFQQRVKHPSHLVTFLREPIQHLMSQLAWVNAHDYGGARAVLKFGRDPRNPSASNAFTNRQCKQLSTMTRSKTATCDMERALKRLSNFFFIGITEFYDVSLCMLYWKLNGHLHSKCRCLVDRKSFAANYSIVNPKNVARKMSLHKLMVNQADLHLFQTFTYSDTVLFAHALHRLFSTVSHCSHLGFPIIC